MKAKGSNIACEMAGQAYSACDQAIQQGLKVQEEARQYWGAALKPSASTWGWQDQFNKLKSVTAMVQPTMQKQTEEAMQLLDKSAKMENELRQKASEAVQTPMVVESCAKWMEFWKMWVEAVHKNTESVIQFDARVLNFWMEFAQKQYDAEHQGSPKKA